MLFLIFAFMLISVLLLGNGTLFSRIIRLHSVRNPFLYFWLGIFFTSTLAMFASFFVPINNFALLIFTILGLIGLPKFIAEFRADFGGFSKGQKILFALFFLIAILIICSYGHNPRNNNYIYDTALYHANAVRWLNEYGAVFGLGNLHYRLGMNSLWLAFAAILDNFIFDGRTPWILPTLWLIGGFLFFGYELCKTNSRKVAVFCIVFLSFIAMQLDRPTGGRLGLYFDTVVFVVYAITVLELYHFIIRKELKNIQMLSCLLILAVFSFMLKQIGAINCVFVFGFAMYVLLSDRKFFLKNAIKTFLPAGIAFAVMITNNCILSGYLFFPLPVFAMPFDWTMPKELVEECYYEIIWWARAGGPYAHIVENDFWYWFKLWLIRHNKIYNWIVYIIPFILSIFFWSKIIFKEKNKTAIFFAIWSFANIAFWFKAAPDLRFGSGFFFVNFALSLMFFIRNTDFTIEYFWNNKIFKRIIYSITCIFAVVIIVILFLKPNYSILITGKMGTDGVRKYTVKNVKYPYDVWTHNEGEFLAVGNCPLPASPYPMSLEKYGIEKRDNDFLGAGFRATK
ncbi:MAG: hypothetical protein FWF51_06665 [Chitinivibrionia bacterium]|nr:hypothetical protein [Chitinivibrionia bacterium]